MIHRTVGLWTGTHRESLLKFFDSKPRYQMESLFQARNCANF
jgi:hypothetical protein